MSKNIVVALILSFSLFTMSGAAVSAEDNDRPCSEEIKKFCKDLKPGTGSIAQCLKEHESELSASCKNTFQVCEVRMEFAKKACSEDVKQFCKGIKPGGGRLAKCLNDHKNELSAACREKVCSADCSLPSKADGEPSSSGSLTV